MNLKEKAGVFGRFGVAWTPTILVLDSRGVERHRIEGFLPRADFRAQLELGLARTAFMSKKFDEAGQRYEEIANRYPEHSAEAMYWAAVSKYSATHEAEPLTEVARKLEQQYPSTPWAARSSIWLPAEAEPRLESGKAELL